MSDFLFSAGIRLMILVLVIPAHECAHAVVAGWLGDDTAKLMGRNTLNPIKHLDPMGSLLLVFTGFGWAKPVPITGRGFKNFKRDMALTALAGPVANVLLAIVFSIIYKILVMVVPIPFAVVEICFLLIWTTLSLAVFNMLPIPPLDGSRLLTALLPNKIYYSIMRYERVIMAVLMLLLFTGRLSLPISGVTRALYTFVDGVTGFLGHLPGIY